jgi:hypothetical protein
MTFSLILFCLLLIPLVWVTAIGRDAWPFSHYPMFSRLTDVGQVVVFRIALEKADGEIVWWKSEFFRYPEFIGRMLKQCSKTDGPGSSLYTALQKEKYLAEVLRLIAVEGRDPEYRAIHIVRRTAGRSGEGKPVLLDQTLERIPLESIKRIPLGI